MISFIRLFILLFLFHLPTNVSAEVKNRVLFLGDSLTEGFGINPGQSYPQLLQKKLQENGFSIKVINSGVSGSTSASAVSRLRWLLQTKPTHLVLALGANDGLRGQSIKALRENLKKAIVLAKSQDLKVLLLGMRIPPNYGLQYSKDFFESYQIVADLTGVSLLPFLLKNIAGKSNLNLADGIHPNAKGHSIMAENIYPFLKVQLLN
ncbi:arylesterase [Candidatus Thioglobus sp.]|nr:arylesterase [Candidatus Thioglobus sp.]